MGAIGQNNLNTSIGLIKEQAYRLLLPIVYGFKKIYFKFKIPNYKFQITNKSQIQNTKVFLPLANGKDSKLCFK